MKTTVDIADPLLELAKARAAREGRTLKEIVEQALHAYLEAGRPRRKPFRLKRRSFKGTGLQPGLAEGRWEEIRSLIYPV